MAAEPTATIQDAFLKHLRDTKADVTLFLVNGIKLQGQVREFDRFTIVLVRGSGTQVVYKHAISTIMPSQPIDLAEIERTFSEQMQKKKPTLLQEVFLSAVRRSGGPVTMFLVNGVMLQGEIAAFDLFCMLLQREGMSQLVYKHAISTVQPEHPVSFIESDDEESGG